MQPLNDEELTKVLSEWRAPRAPASLERRVLGEQRLHWWQWMVRGRIQVPVPLAAMALVALLVWGAVTHKSSGVGPDPMPSLQGFHLVEDLQPRIIRGSYENN